MNATADPPSTSPARSQPPPHRGSAPIPQSQPRPEDAYLAAGVPEMILDRLAAVAGLTVIASGSALAIESEAMTVRRGRARNSVRATSSKAVPSATATTLRVAARLVDARTGTQVWATRADRKLDRPVRLQDEIAAHVAQSHSMTASKASRPWRPRRPTRRRSKRSSRSCRARADDTWHDQGHRERHQQFTRAIEIDPNSRQPMPVCTTPTCWRRNAAMNESARNAATQYADRACAPDRPCVRLGVRGARDWSDTDDVRREDDFRRGLELDASNVADCSHYSCSSTAPALRRRAATARSRTAHRSDLATGPVHAGPAPLSGRRRPERGRWHATRAGHYPDFQPALQRYAKYRWMHHGRLAEAAQIIEHAIEVDPENPWSRHTAVAIYLDLDDAATARRVAAGTPSSASTVADPAGVARRRLAHGR